MAWERARGEGVRGAEGVDVGRTGWTTSQDSTAGQFISNWPRLVAVWTAMACLLSRNLAWLTHPAPGQPHDEHHEYEWLLHVPSVRR